MTGGFFYSEVLGGEVLGGEVMGSEVMRGEVMRGEVMGSEVMGSEGITAEGFTSEAFSSNPLNVWPVHYVYLGWIKQKIRLNNFIRILTYKVSIHFYSIGKSKYVFGYGSLSKVKCHHSCA